MRCLAFISIAVLLWLPLQHLKAQESTGSMRPIRIAAKTHYGYIIPHRVGFRNLIRGHVGALELDFDLPASPKHQWARDHGLPNYGLSFMFWDMANPDEIGYVISLAPYVMLKVAKSERFRLDYRFSVGAGVFTKRFDRVTNHKQIAIGSHVNGYMSMALCARTRIGNHWEWLAGFGLNHYSNGAWVTPNLGLNMPTLHTGFVHQFGDFDANHNSMGAEEAMPKHEINTWCGGGVKENITPDGPKYTNVTAGLEWMHGLSGKFAVGPALDVYYSESVPARVSDDPDYLGSLSDRISVAALGNIRVTIEKASITGAVGVYLLNQYKLEGSIVNRLTLRYRITPHFSPHISVKTHKAKADYLEIGLAYHIKRW